MNKAVPASTSTKVYYSPLVRWNMVDEIVFLTEPHEHSQVRQLLVQTLDHAVMEAALEELPPHDQVAFLELCRERYHDEELLEWLEQRSATIKQKLQTIIQQTKRDIRTLLEDAEAEQTETY